MCAVHNLKSSTPNVWIARVTLKISAHEFVVPGPAMLCIGGSMDTHVTTPCLDVSLESNLLIGIQHISGCTQKNHSAIFLQLIFGEEIGILRRVNFKSIFLPEFLNGFDTFWNGPMVVSFCF